MTQSQRHLYRFFSSRGTTGLDPVGRMLIDFFRPRKSPVTENVAPCPVVDKLIRQQLLKQAEGAGRRQYVMRVK